VSSNEYTEVELRTRLMIAIQSLEFNCPNIIIAVSNDNDVKEHMIQSEKIIEELGYTPVIIGYGRIKIEGFQPYIVFEPVFEKYKGTGFLTMSLMRDNVISQKEA